MSAGGALRAALADTYEQSWRLVLLNTGLSLALLPLVVAALWAPLSLVAAAILLGPLAMALMHCAVVLAETNELRLGCALAGLRLHWRRGLTLGSAAVLVALAGGVAVVVYWREGVLLLSAIVLYLLAAFAALQLCLWPLAVQRRTAPLRSLLGAAVQQVLRRPLDALLLVLALTVVNVLGAAAALMPLLTVTVAYSFVAAAHFAVPPSPGRSP